MLVQGDGGWGEGPLKKRIIELKCCKVGGDVNYLVVFLSSGRVCHCHVIYEPEEKHKTMKKRKQMKPGY